jgi:hypothetical protein
MSYVVVPSVSVVLCTIGKYVQTHSKFSVLQANYPTLERGISWMYTHAYRSLVCTLMIHCLEMFFLLFVKMYINSSVLSIRHLFCTVVLKIQRVIFLGRIVNISLFRKKAVLRGNVFTMEGPGKENRVPCFKLCDWEHDEVKKLKEFSLDSGC